MRSRYESNSALRPKHTECSLQMVSGDQELSPVIGEQSEVKDGEDVQIEGDQPEAQVETREVQGVRTPYKPSPKEIAEHNLTHLNYRDWCPTWTRGE